jgi:hypothetical protein
MPKKKPDTSDKLTILGISIGRPASVTEAAGGTPLRLDLSVEVENTTDQPLHVWATRKGYNYDAATQVLSVQLAESTQELPPTIKMISNHPRIPTQVVVNAKSRTTIKVPVPATIRRPGTGQGGAWVEEPIGQIARVDIQVQYAPEPIQYRPGENASDLRKRLREHGDVVQAVITPTTETEK